MGSLVCLQAQDEFTPAESQVQPRLHTPAPPSAHVPLTEGNQHAAIGKLAHYRVLGHRGQGAVWFGERPRNEKEQERGTGRWLQP